VPARRLTTRAIVVTIAMKKIVMEMVTMIMTAMMVQTVE
jgi:hypothetical protein